MGAKLIVFLVIASVVQSSRAEALLNILSNTLPVLSNTPLSTANLPGSNYNKGQNAAREAEEIMFNEFIRLLPTGANTSTPELPGTTGFPNTSSDKYHIFILAYTDQAYVVAPESRDEILANRQKLILFFDEWLKGINDAVLYAVQLDDTTFDAQMTLVKSRLDTISSNVFADVNSLMVTILLKRIGGNLLILDGLRTHVQGVIMQAVSKVLTFNQDIFDAIRVLHDQVHDGPAGRQAQYTARYNIIKQKQATGNTAITETINLGFVLLDLINTLPRIGAVVNDLTSGLL